MNNRPELYGLVLSGGRSERMGTDKGTLNIHGVPQRTYLFDLLSDVCSKVFTSCHSGQCIAPNLNPILDRFDVQGPLNGILSALHTHPDHAFLAVAVDMPAIDFRALQLLINARDPARVATCFFNSERSWPEPLLTIWEPSAHPLLIKFCEGDERPMEFLRSQDVCMAVAPSITIFQNVNTPDELREFVSLATHGRNVGRKMAGAS